MRALQYILATLGAVLMVGFIAAIVVETSSPVKGNPNADARTSQTRTDMITATKTPATTALPDIQYLPVYTDAFVMKTELKPYLTSYSLAQLTYAVPDDFFRVTRFYNTVLPKSGWRLLYSNNASATYLWTDPGGLLPWHLSMDVVLEPTLEGKTVVVLSYERIPDVENNLPVYTGAQQIKQEEGQEFTDTPLGKQPMHVITKTFVSDAPLDKIESYYNTTLIEHGWYFFDRYASMETGGPQTVTKQTGSMTSQEGLFFTSDTYDTSTNIVERVDLFITSSPVEGGRNRVQMRALLYQRHSPSIR